TATSGGVYVRELDALSLTASATGGAVDVQTANGTLTVTAATGTGVTLEAGGAGSDIVLNGAVHGGGGNVSLTAGSTGNHGAIVGGAFHSIAASSLTATGSSIGASDAYLST